MKKILALLLFFMILSGGAFSQDIGKFKLTDKRVSLNSFDAVSGIINQTVEENSSSSKTFQLKKRKTVNSYFGAGYSFMIFTNSYMSNAFPVLDTRNGNFLTNIGIFFGFAIAQAVTLEIEPTILFTSNNKQVDYKLSTPYVIGNTSNEYAHTYTNGIIALPIAINARFFPFFKLKSYARLIFIGGGVGAAWIREENDVWFNNNPTTYGFTTDQYRAGITTSQWAPVFKVMAGVTGTGGQFGFGGELRYNIIPLKQDTSEPFATRFAKDFNSVDITLRFYFSL
jgi:hypothetical protein